MKKLISFCILCVISIFIISFINIDSESTILPGKVQFVFKMNKAQADKKEPCAIYECKKGQSCWPDLGFECAAHYNGARCYTEYDCD